MPRAGPPKAPLTSLPDDVQMKHAWQIRAIFQTTRILHLNHVQSGAQNLLEKNWFHSPRRRGQTSVGHFSLSPPPSSRKKTINLVLVGCCFWRETFPSFSIQKFSSPLYSRQGPPSSPRTTSRCYLSPAAEAEAAPLLLLLPQRTTSTPGFSAKRSGVA